MRHPTSAELRIDYPNGSKLQLFGADKPDRLRGVAFSGVSFDEYGLHPPNVFSEVLSKALADHLGYAIFAGTIKGRNQLYTTYEAFKDDPPAATPEGAEPSDETDGTGAWGTRSV
ncbi:MAG: hypothetical protein V3T48_11685 [Vicinamibacterales bacterium]